jgi:hypothetical protein
VEVTILTGLEKRFYRYFRYQQQKLIAHPEQELLRVVPSILRVSGRHEAAHTYGRYLRTSRLPYDPLANSGAATLELLFVASGKDLLRLRCSIACAVQSVSNPVGSITVVTPASSRSDAHALVESLPETNCPINILADDDLLSSATLMRLSSHFGRWTGWISQQLLKLSYAKASQSPGVLVIDADTMLLRRRSYLNDFGVQVITPTLEEHVPYYTFLKEIGLLRGRPEFTFVPHHMTYQSDIVRALFDFLGITDADELAQVITDITVPQSPSAVSVDYEMYAQFLMAFFPDRYQLALWSNTPSQATHTLSNCPNSLNAVYKHWGSVSFHSYLETT